MRNVVLTGMMGSGKTTCGRLLARRLGLQFVDMDEELVRRAGCPVSELFAKYGEDYFRNLESALARELGAGENRIIATGGGVVLRPENMAALRGNGIVFFLNRSADAIFDGVDLSDRPLAQNGKAAFLKTFAARENKYRTYADVVIEEFSTPAATVEAICRALAAAPERRS